MIGSMNSEDMKAYPSGAESTSCTAVRSSAFNSGKSVLLNEETLLLIGSPEYLEDVEAYPSEGFISLNLAGIEVENSSAALSIRSLECHILEVCVGVSSCISG